MTQNDIPQMQLNGKGRAGQGSKVLLCREKEVAYRVESGRNRKRHDLSIAVFVHLSVPSSKVCNDKVGYAEQGQAFLNEARSHDNDTGYVAHNLHTQWDKEKWLIFCENGLPAIHHMTDTLVRAANLRMQW